MLFPNHMKPLFQIHDYASDYTSNDLKIISFKELRRLTDEYCTCKQSCELIQSEIIKLQQVESSVTIQLQMNEQAISHLNEQIERKHQKGTYILYYD